MIPKCKPLLYAVALKLKDQVIAVFIIILNGKFNLDKVSFNENN